MNPFRALLFRLVLLAAHVGFIRPLLRLYWGARFRKRNLVPRGPCLMVANHNSHVDAALLMALFPLGRLHRVHPVAAADYFGTSWFRRTMAMLLMNGIPIERQAPTGKDALAPMVEALEAGESLIFFPEGSRGEPGVVAPFRPGVGRLVQKIPGLLIVPVFLSGPERTWPRGETVPLPLGIDVHVGRPRVYDRSLEPREIAEQVRADVLALAPPAPPVPGPRPEPPMRIVVCGVDPLATRDLFQSLCARVGQLGPTVGIGSSILEADASGVRDFDGPLPLTRSRAWPAALAWAFRTGGIYRGDRFAAMVERARVDEALEDGRRARFVVGHGSPLVDLLVWAEAGLYRGVFDDKELQQVMLYLSGQRRIPWRLAWRFARRAPEVWLLNVFDLARLHVPDLLVLERTSPQRAMERLRARGDELEPHQNEAFVADLLAAYEQVADVLRRRGRVEVVAFDPDESGVETTTDVVDEACRRRLVRAAAVGAPS